METCAYVLNKKTIEEWSEKEESRNNLHNKLRLNYKWLCHPKSSKDSSLTLGVQVLIEYVFTDLRWGVAGQNVTLCPLKGSFI